MKTLLMTLLFAVVAVTSVARFSPPASAAGSGDETDAVLLCDALKDQIDSLQLHWETQRDRLISCLKCLQYGTKLQCDIAPLDQDGTCTSYSAAERATAGALRALEDKYRRHCVPRRIP